MTVLAQVQPSAAPDQRSGEILDSARRAFVEKGFDGASMQDLARATGMSVGNFYRYFPSKAAIVAAIVARDLAEVEQDFRAIIESPQPLDALRALMRQHIEGDFCRGDGALWAEITAAAARKPEIGTLMETMEAEIIGYLTRVFGASFGMPATEAAGRYSAHARLLMMVFKGSAMRPAGAGTPPDGLNELILRTIDRTLKEISDDHAKG